MLFALFSLSRLCFGFKHSSALLQHALTLGVHIDAGGVQADVAEDAFEDVQIHTLGDGQGAKCVPECMGAGAFELVEFVGLKVAIGGKGGDALQAGHHQVGNGPGAVTAPRSLGFALGGGGFEGLDGAQDR